MRDADRPAVLAHRRFVEERASLATRGLASRFEYIHDINMWGAAASVSGLGSEADAAAALRARLPALLAGLGVTSLLDAPCGDAGWINRVDLGVRIVGVDIVPGLIDRLQARVAAADIGGDLKDLREKLAICLPRGTFKGAGGMRERALLVGGDLTIESRPDAGTTVRLRVPTG